MSSKAVFKAGRKLPLAGIKGVAKLSRWAGRVQGRREARPSSPGFIAFAAGSGAGAAAEYLLDPQQGKRRRSALRERTVGRLRREAREAGKGR